MTLPYTESNHREQTKLTSETSNSFDIPDEFDTVQYRVVKILQQFPEARNSDKIMLHRFYKLFEGIDTRLDNVQTTPESITRARRKVQSHNPELAAEPQFIEARSLKAEQYKEHYRRQE